MVFLAVESAHFSLSAALVREEEVLAYGENKAPYGGDSLLLPLIQELFHKAALTFQEIAYIVVSLGPGSFTGTRVGVAAARGFSLALKVPVLGINSFEWVAHSYKKSFSLGTSLLVALESKREERFVALFSQELEPMSEATYLRPAQMEAYLSGEKPVFTGDAASSFCLSASSWMPDARHLAFYAQEKLKGEIPFEEAKPFYLRPPEISCVKF